MNKKKLTNLRYKLLKIRPQAIRIETAGWKLPPIDHQWQIRSIENGSIELYNINTMHVLPIGFDNIKEFRTPDYLLLRCQIFLQGNRAWIEPLVVRS